jgi:hypothetical protein
MSLSPQGLREVPVVRRRQRSRPAALHHPRPERVNPDASRFYCGPGNVGREPHADGGRDGCVDSAGRRRARSPVASSWSTRQCNSAGRDRNGHRSAPGPGSGHTRTSGPRPASAIPGKRRRRGRREARRMRDGRYTARHAIRRLPITQTVGGLGPGAAPLHFAGLRRRRACWSLQRPVPYPPRRGAAQPGDSSAPRLGYQPVVGKHRLPPSVRK